MKIFSVLILCSLIYSSVFSQESNEYKFDIQKKSESTAISYSLLGTIIPITSGILLVSKQDEVNYSNGMLILSGCIIGPGIGHIYAHNDKSFLIGAGIRFPGLILFFYGVSNLDFLSSYGNDDAADIGLIGGSAIILFGIIRDFATVDNSVRIYNKKLYSANYSISPTIYTQNDNLTFGLQFKLTK